MRNITLLDCTLRDGGYVNNWQFGEENIKKIVRKVIQAGVEIVECGYLSTKNAGDIDTARYSSIADVKRAYAPKKGSSQSYAVMINFGEYPIELLGSAEEQSPILRVAFHKKDLDAAMEYLYGLKERGYQFYAQPMGALNYTDEEYIQLIRRVNELSPNAFYIVDSFGVMELKDFRRLMFLADHNLAEGIVLGYHSHNNLQQAYSNAKYLTEQNLEHDVLIDASVFGMGRGAGNLNLELFAKYLNENYYKNYNIEPILEVFDESLKSIFANNFWGYSMPFYLSSVHNCHPNYADFFAEKNTLSVKSMHELLSMISEEDKSSFSIEKAGNYYRRYQENYIDDHAALAEIRAKTDGNAVLILAPGLSLKKNTAEIKAFIEEKQPVVFGIHKAFGEFAYDYLFVSNERRLSQEKPANVKQYIVTSNLPHTDGICVNYSSYLCSNEKITDDPTMMLINLLAAAGVHSIAIAGFDGFRANSEENYFAKGMSMGSNIASKMHKNDVIREMVAKLKEQMELSFLTPSLYVQEGGR